MCESRIKRIGKDKTGRKHQRLMRDFASALWGSAQSCQSLCSSQHSEQGLKKSQGTRVLALDSGRRGVFEWSQNAANSWGIDTLVKEATVLNHFASLVNRERKKSVPEDFSFPKGFGVQKQNRKLQRLSPFVSAKCARFPEHQHPPPKILTIKVTPAKIETRSIFPLDTSHYP